MIQFAAVMAAIVYSAGTCSITDRNSGMSYLIATAIADCSSSKSYLTATNLVVDTSTSCFIAITVSLKH